MLLYCFKTPSRSLPLCVMSLRRRRASLISASVSTKTFMSHSFTFWRNTVVKEIVIASWEIIFYLLSLIHHTGNANSANGREANKNVKETKGTLGDQQLNPDPVLCKFSSIIIPFSPILIAKNKFQIAEMISITTTAVLVVNKWLEKANKIFKDFFCYS